MFKILLVLGKVVFLIIAAIFALLGGILFVLYLLYRLCRWLGLSEESFYQWLKRVFTPPSEDHSNV